MKRLLLQSIIAIPYTIDQAVDRLGALSGVLGVHVSTAEPDTIASISLTHSDTEDGTFEPVLDERMFLDGTQIKRDDNGKVIKTFTTMIVSAGELLNVDIDLVGCKQFVKLDVQYAKEGVPSATVASYAFVLGDYDITPQ